MSIHPKDTQKDIKTIPITETIVQYKYGYFNKWEHDTHRKWYIRDIWDILKKMYPKYLKINDSGITRLYDIPGDSNTYSMLNYVSTNQVTFTLIINYINKLIYNSILNNTPILPTQLYFDEDKSNWETLIKNDVKYMINKYKNEIFKNGGDIFSEIIKTIEKTTKRGYISEKDMRKFIKICLPNV